MMQNLETSYISIDDLSFNKGIGLEALQGKEAHKIKAES